MSDILIASILIFLSTFIPSLIPLILDKKSVQIQLLMSFVSGVLIAVTFYHLIPLSVQLQKENLGYYILLGFLIFYILERFIIVHPCQEHGCVSHHIGIGALIGLSLHCLLTGFSLGIAIDGTKFAGTSLSPLLFAICVHKIPESFSLSTLLVQSKISTQRVFIYLLIYCFMTPLGIYLSKESLINFGLNQSLYSLFAISTGTFIYIATSDLLPQIHRRGRERFVHLFAFLTGVILILAI